MPDLTAEEIVSRSMKIAGDLCVYTNHCNTLEVINRTESDAEITKPVLGYWRARGRANQVKHILAYMGVDYDLQEYEPTPDKENWLEVKHTLGMDFPNLPYFIDGETKLTECRAVMKYVAKKW